MSLVMIAKTQTFSSTYHGICTSKNHESFTAPPVWCLGFLGKHQPRLQRRISQRNRPKCPNRLREWSPRVGKGQQQTPWNMIPSQKERVVFQLSFFRVELLNFGGVSFWLALMIASSICELVKKSKWPLALFWCLQSNYLLCKTHNFGDAFCNSIVILKRKENINISYQYTYHIISYQYIISYHKYNYIYIYCIIYVILKGSCSVYKIKHFKHPPRVIPTTPRSPGRMLQPRPWRRFVELFLGVRFQSPGVRRGWSMKAVLVDDSSWRLTFLELFELRFFWWLWQISRKSTRS